jgi:hypothetical protein
MMVWKATVFLLCLLLIGEVAAAEDGALSSIPHAISDRGIYKVRILEIDSVAVGPRTKYRLDAGPHTVTVELLLELEWSLDQRTQPEMNNLRDIRLEILPGKHYQLAARVDVNAPADDLAKGTFWSVIVYRETEF